MTLDIPINIPMNANEMAFFKSFLQGQLNRRVMGGLRYGAIKSKQRYMSRLSKELRVYKKTGNMEHLLNIAVYAYLEAYAPENKKFHWDASVDSATRKEFGGGEKHEYKEIS